MPAAPLICSSRGVVTVLSTISAPAPIYWVDTWTWGGTSGGYWAMGSTSIQMAPAKIMTNAMDMANIGRWMEKFMICS